MLILSKAHLLSPEELEQAYSEVLVIPIGKEKFDADVTESFREKGRIAKEGYSFQTIDTFAVIKGHDIIIDRECVGNVDVNHNINIYEKANTGFSFMLTPTVTATLSLKDLIENYGQPEVNLPTFMGSRYNYNSRVKSNQFQILKEIFGVLKK